MSQNSPIQTQGLECSKVTRQPIDFERQWKRYSLFQVVFILFVLSQSKTLDPVCVNIAVFNDWILQNQVQCAYGKLNIV